MAHGGWQPPDIVLPKLNLLGNQTEDKFKKVQDKTFISPRNMTLNVKPKVIQKAYDSFRSQTAVIPPKISPENEFTTGSADEEFHKISLDL